MNNHSNFSCQKWIFQTHDVFNEDLLELTIIVLLLPPVIVEEEPKMNSEIMFGTLKVGESDFPKT